MSVRRRISNRPKVERNQLKLQSVGGKYVIAPLNMVGSEDTVVMYYDGERYGTFYDKEEAERARDAHKASQ